MIVICIAATRSYISSVMSSSVIINVHSITSCGLENFRLQQQLKEQ